MKRLLPRNNIPGLKWLLLRADRYLRLHMSDSRSESSHLAGLVDGRCPCCTLLRSGFSLLSTRRCRIDRVIRDRFTIWEVTSLPSVNSTFFTASGNYQEVECWSQLHWLHSTEIYSREGCLACNTHGSMTILTRSVKRIRVVGDERIYEIYFDTR